MVVDQDFGKNRRGGGDEKTFVSKLRDLKICPLEGGGGFSM